MEYGVRDVLVYWVYGFSKEKNLSIISDLDMI